MPAGTDPVIAMASLPSPRLPASVLSSATGAAPEAPTSTSAFATRSKRVAASTRPSPASWSIQDWLAEMKTSAGAPAWICRASAEEPASDTVRSWPESSWKAGASRSIASLRLAAAKTVTLSAAAGVARHRAARAMRKGAVMEVSWNVAAAKRSGRPKARGKRRASCRRRSRRRENSAPRQPGVAVPDLAAAGGRARCTGGFARSLRGIPHWPAPG